MPVTALDACPKCGHSFAIGQIPVPCAEHNRIELFDDLNRLTIGQVVLCPRCAAILQLASPAELVEVWPPSWFALALRCEAISVVVASAQATYRLMRLERTRTRYAKARMAATATEAKAKAKAEPCEGRGEC